MGDWIGIVAPAKTPQAIVDKLNAAINKALAVADVKAKIEKIGTQVAGGTPAEFDAFIVSELDRWNKVVNAMGLKIN
jgi:tripartite-type tricarboxylate transporter receptor subunit TctC